MNEIKNILINNWQLILSVVIFILSFILQLIKKKPFVTIYQVILPLVIKGILYAENCEIDDVWNKSAEKLRLCTAFVICNLCDYFGLERNAKNYQIFEALYSSLIQALVEDILDTPQKKIGKGGI